MEITYLVIFLVCFTVIMLITFLEDVFEFILSFIWSALMLEKVPVLNPVSFFTSLTVFGGTGYALTRFSQLNAVIVFIFSFLLAVLSIAVLYYLIVKPKDISETSLSYSMKQLVGLRASVTVPIPSEGYGEVIVKLGGGNSNQIAASYDKVDISIDEDVFVVDEKDGVVFVSILKI